MQIRTRYAPSPTGYMHIGGARTALFCYLFARSTGGKFVLRIEDTDLERNVMGGAESQLSNLDWLGISPDESPLKPGAYGPYVTSERLDRHVFWANKLLENGTAYECFCTPEQLENDRALAEKNHEAPRYNRRCLRLSPEEKERLRKTIMPAIRVKLDWESHYEWDDLVRGKISFPGNSLTDPIVLRSSKIPTYNFAVTVDDHEMAMTHVLRGEEHIANTPYQLAIRAAMQLPNDGIRYGHFSVITDETGKKLSKRNKELKQFVEDYKNEGFPSGGVVNFLALLGWTPADNKEIKSLGELEKAFSLSGASKAPAMFDEKKLRWICAEHVKRMTASDYLGLVSKTQANQLPNADRQWLDAALLLFKAQVSSAKEAVDLVKELFVIRSSPASVLPAGAHNPVLAEFKKLMLNLTDWSPEAIKLLIAKVKDKTGAAGKDLFMPIRTAVTGQMHGPDLPNMLYLLGKERVLGSLSNV